MSTMPESNWLGDSRQYASVRRIQLDDGPEKGVGALAFSTGGGLDFWVLIDRALDIGPLWRDGRPVAWQSPAGFRHPALVDPADDGGFGFGRGFSGFLMTCGLAHTRAPRNGHPQHGRLPFLPARLTSFGEHFASDAPHLFCEGEIVQWRHGGEALRMRRRIEAPIGGRSLTIVDQVSNIGGNAQQAALLYHMNIGFPAFQPDSTVWLDGKLLLGPSGSPVATSPEEAFSTPLASPDAVCSLNQGAVPVLQVSVSGDTLPHLQLWRDLRPHHNVLAIEPCTSRRPAGDEDADEPLLQPGECIRFRVHIAFA